MIKKILMTGNIYGNLLVLQERGKWLDVECICGNSFTVRRGNVLAGYTKSCGCYRNQKIKEACGTHGQSRTKLYFVWKTMRRRCSDPAHHSYPWYGAKGIKVCERWQDFDNFYYDMGSTYREGLSIDRINPDKNYCPENCRWLPTIENRVRGLHGTAS